MNNKTEEAEQAEPVVTLHQYNVTINEMRRRYEQAEAYVASLTQMNNNYATALNRAEADIKRLNEEFEKLRGIKARASEIADLKGDITRLMKQLEIADREKMLWKDIVLKYDDIFRAMLG